MSGLGTPAVAVASEQDVAEWERYVGSRDDATGYHVWAWRSVFFRAFGHEPVYLIARCDDRVVGVLPMVYVSSLLFGRSLTSLPFLNYGGVVADSAEAADALIETAAAIGRERRCKYVELRHQAQRFPRLPVKQHKVAMRLPLEKDMWERLDRKVRNQVRKAQKSGLTVEAGGQELLDPFYTVFARNMRDLGTPVYGRAFFAEILRIFPDRAKAHVVRLRDVPVAASITYRSGTTTEVPWASSVRDYNPLCPNTLLYWHMIETAVAEGSAVFDFGRSTPGEGTYRFKEQWHAESHPLHWEYPLLSGSTLPDNGPTNRHFQLAIATWKHLPISLATRLGPHIVRGIP